MHKSLQGSNPGGGRVKFSAPVQTEPASNHVKRVPGLFYRAGKRQGLGVDQPSRLSPILKKDYSYTSTPPLELHGLF